MRRVTGCCGVGLFWFGALWLGASPPASQGNVIIGAGFDLFTTAAPTTFEGFEFEGAPVETFDFGGARGGDDTGNTDVIVERLGEVDPFGELPPSFPSQPQTVDIEIVELSLVSVEPIDVGQGIDFHFIGLQTGLASLGEMIVTFFDELHGVLDMLFDLAFEIRLGNSNGPLVVSESIAFGVSDVPWSRNAPTDALQIDGVNYLLNGLDSSADFWAEPFTLTNSGDATHSVTAATPEPASLLLLGAGGLILAVMEKWKAIPQRLKGR